ncbi:prepilin-type N-terminal cleavage/methylation domain-containing protein [Leptolyngbya sp. 15MV]|nr:prepilin-type N-terminal cleavage/methylation domain-containing protein [Leptolyngbya sp. 15MV]
MRKGAFALRRGFSLIELVIVVVIIGIIGAIAIPRMSRGAAGASESALVANLAQLRGAIDLFQTENGVFPTEANIVAALTTYSDGAGNLNATRTTTFIFGPYLRSIPELPVGAAKGNKGIAAAPGPGVGWIYSEATGQIRANTTATEVDARGRRFDTY